MCDLMSAALFTNGHRLIAIMLGRLEMDVDDCISAYSKLMELVFAKKSNWSLVGWTGVINAQFESTRLKNALEEVFTDQGIPKTDLLNDGQTRGCRV